MTLVKSKPRKPSLTHRKLTGSHHRRSSRYNKTYWPYIPIVLIFGLGFLISNALSPRPKVLGDVSNFSESSLLSSTNQQRQDNSQQLLSLNQQLDQAAQAKANNMVADNYWSHNTPSGQTPWSFITAAGYNYQYAGENLAYGFSSATDTISGWMNSPIHRANILSPDYTNVGFGVASSPNYINQGPEVLVVAMYAEPVSGTAASITFNVPPPNAVLGDKTTATEATIQPPANLISRIQVLTGGSAVWSLSALSFTTGILVCYFILRHTRRFKRLLVDGEHFLTRHYILDICLAILITGGYILTRTSGVIR